MFPLVPGALAPSVNHVLDLTGYSQFHDTMKPGGSYQMKIGLDITIRPGVNQSGPDP